MLRLSVHAAGLPRCRFGKTPTSVWLARRRSSASNGDDDHQQRNNARGSGSEANAAGAGARGSGGQHVAQPLTRQRLQELERIALVHVAPARISDHVCVHVVRGARWCADRLFHDRLVHRAMLQYLTAGDAAKAAVTALHWRRLLGKDKLAPPAPPAAAAGNGGASADEATASAAGATRDGAAAAAGGATDGSNATTTTARRSSNIAGGDHSVRRAHLLGEHATRLGHNVAVADLAALRFYEVACVALWRRLVTSMWFGLFFMSPRFGHRFAAYIAEENAVVLTHMINDIHLGKIENELAPGHVMELYNHPTELSEPQGTNTDRTASARCDVSTTTATDAPAAEIGDIKLRDMAVLFRADELYFCERHHAWADDFDRYKAQNRAGAFR